MKKSILFLAGAVVLGAAGGGAWWWSQRDGAVVQYKTARVERGNLQSTISASGTVNPVTQVSVGTQVSGQVKDLYVDFNSVVKAGQLIAQIDPETFDYRVRSAQADLDAARAQVLTAQANSSASRAQVAKAQMDLEEAKRDAARKESLVAQQFIAQSEADKARSVANIAVETLKGAQAQLAVTEAQIKSVQASVAQKESALAQARIDLERTKIRSPVNGIVIKRTIERGQTVAASLQAPELFVIAQNLSDMQVDASIDESDIGRVRVGQRATFTVDAFAGQTFEGEVRQVRNAAQTVANVVTYTAVVGFSNTSGRLLPGMTANVRVVTDTRENVLKVPNAALRMRIAGVEPGGGSSAPAPGGGGPAHGAGLSGPDRLLALLIPSAQAQGFGGGGGLRDRLVEQLQLNEAQQTKLDAVLADFRPRLAALRELPEEQRQAEREKVMVPMRAAINAFLTKEQKARYAQMQAAQQARGGGQGAGGAASYGGGMTKGAGKGSAPSGAASGMAGSTAGGAKESTGSHASKAASNEGASSATGPTTGMGAGAGGSGAGAASGGGGPLGALRARLLADLALTPAQLDGVDAIMAQLRPKMGALRDLPEAERPKGRERILGEMRAQIGDLLTPAQKPKYQALLAELANRQQTRGRVYLLDANGKPKAVNVRLGISDGTFTELIVGAGANAAEGLAEGAQVIVGLLGGASASGPSGASGGGGGGARPSGPRMPF
jgi:HlyD family secretion protein